MALQRLFHGRGKSRIDDLPIREIDGHADRHCVGIIAPPLRELRAHLVQHPASDEDDQPRFVRVVHELGRRQHAPNGMMPAHECLEPAETLLLHVEDWLIRHVQLTAPQRVRELGLYAQAVHGLPMKPLVVHHRAGAALPLRVVHGRIRVVEQLARLRELVAVDAHADAERGEHVTPCERHQRAHDLVHRFGETHHLIFIQNGVQQDHELVAADAREEVVVAQHGFDALDARAEQCIASRMTEAVVYLLEAVQVDEQHCETRQRPLHGTRDPRRQPLGQGETIGKRRQRIAARIIAELELIALPLVHVRQRPAEQRERAVGLPSRAHANERPPNGAAHGDDTQLHFRVRQRAANDLRNGALQRCDVGGMHVPLHERAIDGDVTLAVTEQLQCAR